MGSPGKGGKGLSRILILRPSPWISLVISRRADEPRRPPLRAGINEAVIGLEIRWTSAHRTMPMGLF